MGGGRGGIGIWDKTADMRDTKQEPQDVRTLALNAVSS